MKSIADHIDQINNTLYLAPQTATLSWLLQEAKTQPQLADALSNVLEYHKKHWLWNEHISTYAQGNNAVSCLPTRWCLITDLVLNGKHIFYNDVEAARQLPASLRWSFGMMPYAGPLEKNPTNPYALQHWYGRNIEWRPTAIPGKREINTDEIHTQDIQQTTTHEKLAMTQQVMFDADSAIHKAYISSTIKNNDTVPLPCAPGHHTYYNMPLEDRAGVKMSGVPFSNEEITKFIMTGVWPQGEWTLKMPLSWQPIILTIPSIGTLTIKIQEPYTHMWIRTQVGKPFICIEPTAREGSKQIPTMIDPWEQREYVFSVELSPIQ